MTWLDADPSVAPLLPLRTAADTEGDVSRLMQKFETRGNAPDILRAVANSDRAFACWIKLVDALMYRAELPATDREVAILRMAAVQQTRYEWEEHERVSKAVGIADDVIEALKSNADDRLSALLTPSQSLVVRIVDTVVRDEQQISDDLWREAVATWGEQASNDLLYSIAFWGGFVPLLIRMFRL